MTNRTRQILDDIEDVCENQLALSADLWASIDLNSSQTLEEERSVP